MAWWEWLLLLWVGGTAGLAALLALVVFGQEAVSRLVRRGGADVGADVGAGPVAIDITDQRAAGVERPRESEAAPEPCS